MRRLDKCGPLPLNHMMSVVTIQSRVASGYVGNSAAVPGLQQSGLEAVAIDTALLSNHPAHGGFGGRVRKPGELTEILEGLTTHSGAGPYRAVLTGYLGSAANAAAAYDWMDSDPAITPETRVCVDPVLGDHDRLYVEEALVGFYRDRAVARADILVPNAFEAGRLLGEDTATAARARGMGARLCAMGPRWTVITGLSMPDGIGILATDGDAAWMVETPWVGAPDSGAGDVFAAVLLARLLGADSALPAALSHAAGAVYDLLQLTHTLGKRDLALVEGLEFIAKPKTHPIARPVT